MDRRTQKKLMDMAIEWASELAKFKGHNILVAEEAAKGLKDVEAGRNPDAVLKEVLRKIEDRIGEMRKGAN